MKNTLLKIASVLFLGMAIISCSPEDGKDGATGTAGNNGTNGTNGETGTANVIYSAWIPSNFSSAVGNASRREMQFSYPFSQLNGQSIHDCAVIVYMRITGGAAFTLPSNRLYTSVDFIVFTLTNTLGVEARSNLNPQAPIASAIDPATGLEFKYIIIPGGLSAGRGTTPIDYSKMSYKEICTKFNIPE